MQVPKQCVTILQCTVLNSYHLEHFGYVEEELQKQLEEYEREYKKHDAGEERKVKENKEALNSWNHVKEKKVAAEQQAREELKHCTQFPTPTELTSGLEDIIKHAGPGGGGFVLDESLCWARQQLAKNSVKKVESVPAPFLALDDDMSTEDSWITKKVCC